MRAEPQAEWKSPQAWERFSTSPISPVHPPATLRPEDFFVCLPDFFVSPYRLFAIPLPTFWRLESGRPFIPYGRPRKYVALSPNQPALKLSSNSSIMNDSVVICTKYLVSVCPPVIHPICFEASPPLGDSGWNWRGGMSRAADFAFQKLSWHRLFHRNPSYLFAEIGVILVGGIDDAAS